MHYRRIYILPTRAGWGFAFLLFCMFVAALNYSNSTALFLTFWLTGFVLVGLHRCHRNLLGIALQGATAVPTFAGGAWSNLSSLWRTPRRLCACASRRTSRELRRASRTSRARGAARLNLAVPTTVRGRVLIDGLRLTTALPIGSLSRLDLGVSAARAHRVSARARPLAAAHRGRRDAPGARSLTRWLGRG
jgi:hypothetical protein